MYMIDYRVVKYKNKNYAICMYKKSPDVDYFIIDYKNLKPMLNINKSWYEISAGRIGCVSNNRRMILDQLILGISAKYKAHYIDLCKRDLREKNLKIVNANSGNITGSKTNDTKSNDTIHNNLPKGCGIKPNDIPKYVYYCKPQSGHGEMFVIELTTNGKKHIWKSSSSKEISLKDKLVEIKKKLIDIKKHVPDVMGEKYITKNMEQCQINLMIEFNNILKLSGFKLKKSHLITIPKSTSSTNTTNTTNTTNSSNATKLTHDDVSKTNIYTKKYLATNTAIKSGRRHVNKIPSQSRILPSDIPTYCWYRAADDNKGDCFIIDSHPDLPRNTRTWSTTTRRDVSTVEKFMELKNKLNQLKRSKSKIR